MGVVSKEEVKTTTSKKTKQSSTGTVEVGMAVGGALVLLGGLGGTLGMYIYHRGRPAGQDVAQQNNMNNIQTTAQKIGKNDRDTQLKAQIDANVAKVWSNEV